MTDDINKKPVAGISAAAAVTITTNSLNTSSAQHQPSMETEAGAGQLVDLRDLLAACVAACELGCLEVPH